MRSGLSRGQSFQREFDQQLGFRPRDQCCGTDMKVETPEAATTDEVGHRFTCAAAHEQVFEAGAAVGVEVLIAVGVKPAARAVEHMGEEQFGVAGFEAGAGLAQGRIDAGRGSGHGVPFDEGRHATRNVVLTDFCRSGFSRDRESSACAGSS